ncbi:MAG TPA: hypothetical protein VHS99_13970 [Chloroflexota bacterium]|nr:hypothetical protein [Chloroflexota bacterium]
MDQEWFRSSAAARILLAIASYLIIGKSFRSCEDLMHNVGAGDLRFVAMLIAAFLFGLFGTLASAALLPFRG